MPKDHLYAMTVQPFKVLSPPQTELPFKILIKSSNHEPTEITPEILMKVTDAKKPIVIPKK
jgi:hypothetical protein